MGYVVLAMQLLLSIVLLVAGGTKLMGRESFASSLERMRFPSSTIGMVSVIVPLGEIVLGIAILIPTSAQWSAGIAGCLMAIYALFVVWEIKTNRGVKCACFGNLSSSSMSGATVIRNLILTAVAVAAFVGLKAGHHNSIIDAWSRIVGSQNVIAAFSILSLVVSLIVLFLAIYLLTQYGAISLALDPMREQVGLKKGDLIPDFSLVGVDGKPVTREVLLESAPNLLNVIFASTSCSHCESIFASLVGDESLDSSRIIVVATGDADGVRAKLGSRFGERVFSDVGSVAAKSLKVFSTPTIVQMDSSGRVSSDSESGADKVLKKLASSGD